MAENFIVTAQRRTVQPRATGQIEDVEEITAQTVPSGVGFTRVIPYTVWAGGHVAEALTPIATNIETIMRKYPIVSAIPVQTVGGNALISNEVQFTVTIPSERGSPNPAHTTTVTVPVQVLHDATDFGSYFKPAISALEHAAGL